MVIDPEWSTWNASLQYAMTDAGLRTLLRSGFRDVSHLQLLKRSTANIAFLNLNYHDKLALEHALESGGRLMPPTYIQVVVGTSTLFTPAYFSCLKLRVE